MKFTPVIPCAPKETKNKEPIIRRAYTPKREREVYIKNWHASGMTQAAFCQAHNLHPKTFGRWVKEQQEKHTASIQPEPTPNKQALPVITNLAVCFSSGAQLQFKGRLSGQWIHALLQEVYQCRLN